MSDNDGEYETVGKKKSRRSKRGGAKNKPTKPPEESLEDELIKLLRSEGFIVERRVPNKTAKNINEKGKSSGDDVVCRIFKALLHRLKDPVFDEYKAKTRVKEDAASRSNFNEKKTANNDGKKVSSRNGNRMTNNDGKKVPNRDEKNSKKLNYVSQEKHSKRSKAEKFEQKKKTKRKGKNKNCVEADGRNNSKNKSPNVVPKVYSKKEEKFKKDAVFPKCIRKRDMRVILADGNTDDCRYAKGYIRINPKNMYNAYVNIDEEEDILICGIRDRNRAMDKDLVAVMINPKAEWKIHENGRTQKTGTVVCILEMINSRTAIGTMELYKGKPRLRSRDPRIPPLMIDIGSVPDEVKAQPEAYVNTMFLASIDAWPTPHDCRGSIVRIMGEVGDLDGETTAILLDNGLDVTPYDDELIEGFPNSDYVPTISDLENREDWRNECIFTIDPATAVDLDDAVSCKKLPNGNYEVGVHISDVTHYLEASSPLDKEVSKRATTVYLVNAVYHMLPKSLCQLCSLLPGREKLAFSVIWEMTPEAEVIKHRFAKTVVNSCYQMSYEKAQSMIDEPSREWVESDLPGLKGPHSPSHLCETVNHLYGLSAQMREKRFADGALSINQPKLQIVLDRETRFPISYRMEERQDSNKLIEEFMLLANMTVAKHLYETLPDTAFLRNHGKPLKRVLDRTAEDLGHLGVHLNTESAGSLQTSLSLYEKTGLRGFDQEFVTNCRMMVINTLCAQSMPRANYICCGSIKKEVGLRHFALNVPFYTHFTSPIRRYADCVVHRLLYASMTNTSLSENWSSELCAKIASNCNLKKYSAKIAQEKSNELYFIDLLSRNGPTESMAIVMKVKHFSMDVILCHVGITVTVAFSDIQKKADIRYNNEHSVPTIIVKWKKSNVVQTINVFSMINLQIAKNPKSYAIQGVLLPLRENDTTNNGNDTTSSDDDDDDDDDEDNDDDEDEEDNDDDNNELFVE